MNVFAYLFIILLGSVCGALANWLVDELPYRAGGGAPTHCGPLHYWSLPGFLLDGSRCPHCATPRSIRYPLLELATTAGFVITLRIQGALTIEVVIMCVYITFLLTVLVIDYGHRRVLNSMLGPAAIFALLVGLRTGADGLFNALLGGIVGLGLFLLLAALSRGKLGAGDVKLAGVIGLMTGYPSVLNALIFGVLLGGIAAIFLLVSHRATRKSYMAYAPYLALGALGAFWLSALTPAF